MSRQRRIETLLREHFMPTKLEIEDDSERHSGHAGAQPEGETHYRLLIVSAKFEGHSRVKRHQQIYKILTSEFESGLHALNIKALTPDEEIG